MLMNGSFENWTNGVPDGWTLEQGYIEKATHKHSGSYSAKMSSAEQKVTYLVSDPVSLDGVKWCRLKYADYSYQSNEVRFEAAYSEDGEIWTNYKTLITNRGEYPTVWRVRTVQFFPPDGMNFMRLRIYSFRHQNSNFVDSIELVGSDTVQVDLDLSKGTVELATAGTFCPLNITVKASGEGGDSAAEDALITRQFPSSVYINERVEKVGTGAFFGAEVLTEVNVPNAASIGDSAFRSCWNLKTVNIQNAIDIGTDAFMGCENLTSVKADKTQVIYPYAFEMCMSLFTLDLPEVTSIFFGAFHSCLNLYELIFRNSDTVCSLGDPNALEYTPIANGIGYIYVPRVLFDRYKVATGWSAYSAQFRAIEDYPDICG